MDLGISGKVFIVTGGGKGIGGAITSQLAQEGAIPVIFDRDEAAAESLRAELGADQVHYQKVDLCDTDACQYAVSATVDLLGRIDGLINNAGVNDGVGLESGDPGKFRASLEKNLYHFYDMAHFCLPHLKASQGSILNIGSKTAETGQGNTSGYAAAKGGVMALTREWAVELLKFHIRVNAIIPAEVMTPLYRQWLDTFDDPSAKEKSITDKIPLGNRMTDANEIAHMAVFLLSSKASHITGQHIHVDGGYTHLDRII
ncbi:MAG: SDR family oxidoreductase [Cytophagia bacterium]|nr:SDR family oxidoreductase [Cytophagia bacterium]